MKTATTQQEVILVTGTQFSSREWAEKDATKDNQQLPANEKLKEACWNGLLWEMLPELWAHASFPKKIYLWQILEAQRFFVLELGEKPTAIDKNYSIDPYYFMTVQMNN